MVKCNCSKLRTQERLRAKKRRFFICVTRLQVSAPPGKRVKRFAKISLNAGESKTLNFKLNMVDLTFIGADNKPVVEAGDFTVMVGNLKKTFTLK